MRLVTSSPEPYAVGTRVVVTGFDRQHHEGVVVEPVKPLHEYQVAVEIEHCAANTQIYNVEMRQVRPVSEPPEATK